MRSVQIRATEVLQLAAEEAKMWRVHLTQHARDRMKERGAQIADVRSAMMGATMARHDQDRQTWKLTGGKDIDGDELDVVIATDPIRVVSVF